MISEDAKRLPQGDLRQTSLIGLHDLNIVIAQRCSYQTSLWTSRRAILSARITNRQTWHTWSRDRGSAEGNA